MMPTQWDGASRANASDVPESTVLKSVTVSSRHKWDKEQ